MRIAVVGVGRMGVVHAKLLRQLSGVDSLLIADRDSERARQVAREVAGDAVRDPIEAIKRADAVIVASPPDTHATLVKAAVDLGRRVLCEKPVAADVRGAAELAAYVDRSGVPVFVGFQRRFDPAIAAARQLVMDGSLGLMHLIRLTSTEPSTARSERTNLLRNTVIHDFDLARWLSGSEVESVFAEGSDRELGAFDPHRDPDSVLVTMRLSDGSLCAVTASRLSPIGYDVRVELLGSRDHVVAGWTERTPIRSLDSSAMPIVRRAWPTWRERFEEAYHRELAEFLQPSPGSSSAASIHDGVQAQRISEAARRSLLDGRAVSIDRL